MRLAGPLDGISLANLEAWIARVPASPSTVGRWAATFRRFFASNRGTAVSYDALHYQWAGICTAAGLVDEAGAPRYTLHQLRHTRGSALIAQGQRVEIVQRVLGHRDIRSTLGYAELQEAQVRAALETPHAR